MRIEHVAMYVQDLEAAKAFFVRYFQATAGPEYHNKATGFRSYFLTFADHTRLEIMNKPGVFAPGSGFQGAGYCHIAFSVGSAEQVDALTRRLQADGFEVVSGPRTTGDGYYESCITGVEGSLIELTV